MEKKIPRANKYGNLLRLTSFPQGRTEQCYEPISERFAFEWVDPDGVAAKQKGHPRGMSFRIQKLHMILSGAFRLRNIAKRADESENDI